jgi:predicted lipid-binding transport protein (Tim44 family)
VRLAGPARWQVGLLYGLAGRSLQDAALFYFIGAKMAAAFVDRFACRLIIGRETLAAVTPKRGREARHHADAQGGAHGRAAIVKEDR